MARITPPSGYISWNVYIEDQVIGITDIEARRLIKRDIKLGLIAQVERQAGENFNSPSYRLYNVYDSPGTFSPVNVHPWKMDTNIDPTVHAIATEMMDELTTENSIILITEQ